LTYKGMAVSNGNDAIVQYAQMPRYDPATRERVKHDMLEYCKQDTWAMVEILSQLRTIASVR